MAVLANLFRSILTPLAIGLLALTAWYPAHVLAGPGHGNDGGMAGGHPGEPNQVDRTVDVEASDIAFDLKTIDVKPGETIRFRVHNAGETVHDFTIGTPEMQARHREQMQAMMDADMHGGSHANMHAAMHGQSSAGMMHHNDPNAVMVQPGETRDLIWTFEKTESLEFACNVPGHYEAGMRGSFDFKK